MHYVSTTYHESISMVSWYHTAKRAVLQHSWLVTPSCYLRYSISNNNRLGRGRGRNNKSNNADAQGGGAGVGMEKDAARLDVAARVAAKANGGDGGNGMPSTANIKVSSSGTVRKGKGGRRR